MDLTRHRHLLNETIHRRNQTPGPQPKRGELFNAFTAVTRADDENRHSRVLASLLDPRGHHGQGLLFLRSFLHEIGLEKYAPATDGEAVWSVKTELVLPTRRRIDLLIDGPSVVIGIENKVFAGEGDGQLADYARELGKHHKHGMLVFLTPTGRPPHDALHTDAQHGTPDVIRCAYWTWDNEIPSLHRWLEVAAVCLDEAAPVKTFVEQYRTLVAELGGKPVNEKIHKTIAEDLLGDSRSFEAALDLEQALQLRRVELQVKFWKELKRHLVALGYEVVAGRHVDEQSVRKYFDGESVFPRLDCITTHHWENMPMCIRLEMLDHPQRPYLTWKVVCVQGDRPHSEDAVLKRIDTPHYQVLDGVLASIKAYGSGWATTGWSFLTADLVTQNGHKIDLTRFYGEASKLAGDQADAVIASITQQVQWLYGRIVDALSAHSPP